jgi:hypothetical protein
MMIQRLRRLRAAMFNDLRNHHDGSKKQRKMNEDIWRWGLSGLMRNTLV